MSGGFADDHIVLILKFDNKVNRLVNYIRCIVCYRFYRSRYNVYQNVAARTADINKTIINFDVLVNIRFIFRLGRGTYTSY